MQIKMSKKFLKLSIFIVSVAIVLSSCKNDEDPTPSNPLNGKTTPVFNPNVTYGNMTDQDGNVYKTVTIGTQTWMAENLRTTKYNNGAAISLVTDGNSWENLTSGAYYNNTANADTIAAFGTLYNWYAVNTGKLCPTGWHVPSDAEWTQLTNYLGGESVAGGKLKESGTKHWFSPNTGATNETGFTALPGGKRFVHGPFGFMGLGGYWWSATQASVTTAWHRYVYFNLGDVYRIGSDKGDGFCVRCLRD